MVDYFDRTPLVFGSQIDKSRAARAELNPKTPVDVEAGTSSWEPYYELLLFTVDGWLSSVDFLWYAESPPATFPPLSAFNPPKQLDYGAVRRYTPE